MLLGVNENFGSLICIDMRNESNKVVFFFLGVQWEFELMQPMSLTRLPTVTVEGRQSGFETC